MSRTQRENIDTAPVKPWNWATWQDQKDPVEIVSYPCPNEGAEDTIMIRKLPGDPTSLVEVPLKSIAAFSPTTHSWSRRLRRYYSDDPNVYAFVDELETKEYRKRHDPEGEREHGPDNDLETYQMEGGPASFSCTTNEREDFERVFEVELTSDTLPREVFDMLVAWMGEEDLLACTCRLQKGTSAEGHHHPECEEFDGHN